MKHLIKTSLWTVLTLFVCVTAKAQYSFSVDDLTGEQGATIEMPVKMNNGDLSITDFNCDITLPEGVSVLTDSYGDPAIEPSNRKADHTFDANLQSNGTYRVVAFSTKQRPFSGTEGVVFTTSIVLNAAPGTYTITIGGNLTKIIDGELDNVDCDETTATLIIKGETINLTHDGTAYTNDTQKKNVTVNYTRTFAHTGWQALYIPFAMTQEEWSKVGQVAELSGVSGTAEASVLEWSTVTGNLSANTPYIIKPNLAGEPVTFSAENTTLEAVPADEGSVSKTGAAGTFTLSGIYKEKADMADTGAYGLSKGVFRPTTDNSKTLKPYLIYLTISSVNNAPAMVRSLVDGEATGISGIVIDTEGNGKMFDLQGRETTAPMNGLYIKNGKKVVINK